MSGKLFILSAPSGAGKTSLIQNIIKYLGPSYPVKRVITYTSRTPRASEWDGDDYYFISSHEFGRRIQDGFFLEWSSEYGGYYGSPFHLLQDLGSGGSYIMILDRSGAERIKTYVPDAILIWLYLVDIQVARNRLAIRKTESDDEINRRIELARHEAQQELCAPIYTYHLLHKDFSATQSRLIKIIRSFVGPF